MWDVTSAFAGDEITGRATTEFPFDKFDLTRPTVRAVLFIQSCAVYGLGAVDVALEQEFGEEGKAAEKEEGTGAAAVGLWLRRFTDERKPVSQTRYGSRRLIKLA